MINMLFFFGGQPFFFGYYLSLIYLCSVTDSTQIVYTDFYIILIRFAWSVSHIVLMLALSYSYLLPLNDDLMSCL